MQKKIGHIFLITGISICLIKKKYIYNEYYKNKILTERQEEVLKSYEQWINTIQKGKTIEAFLLENNCTSVAIYGLGRLGKHLYKELIQSKVKISYIIDRKYNGEKNFYGQVPCYGLNKNLPDVDLIIVTVPSEADNIILELKNYTTSKTRSIKDILFAI